MWSNQSSGMRIFMEEQLHQARTELLSANISKYWRGFGTTATTKFQNTEFVRRAPASHSPQSPWLIKPGCGYKKALVANKNPSHFFHVSFKKFQILGNMANKNFGLAKALQWGD
jgi:hypothetical protein